jgi:nitrite reductase/ring-hydroxylating ferredoxin subunit
MDSVTHAANRICASDELTDRGRGIRFQVEHQQSVVPAFVVRYGGEPRAYLNRCGHVGVQLDWDNGNFFDPDGTFIVCAVHWACYNPDTGACVSGPCHGRGLTPVPVEERDGHVWLLPRWGFRLVESDNG